MNRLVTAVLISLVGLNTVMQAQAPGGRPKLVVGIVVDQLRTDYIEYLQKLFGENGFKKLMRDGAYMRDVDFGVPLLDKASGTAMVYTGAYPAFNGVPPLPSDDQQAPSGPA